MEDALTDKELLEKYKNGCWFGDPNFFRFWRILRMDLYNERKAKGEPDPFDVFDGFTGPIFTPIDKGKP